jgi:N-acyl-D-amino-acid deacylase
MVTQQNGELDLVIRGGRLIDGTGNSWVYRDVGVKNGRIVALGRLANRRAARFVDASGLWVVPGFIDSHAHGDFSLVINPPAHSQVSQGVTTEVMGNCGISAYPRNAQSKHYYNDPEGVEVPADWTTVEEYFKLLQQRGIGHNTVSLVGHGTIRRFVAGDAEHLTSTQVQLMRDHVRAAMEAGAVGLSTGLVYPPGVYADTDEIVELARVVAEYGGVYTTHYRGSGELTVQAIEEAITVGEKAEIPVHLSHISISGRSNWGAATRVIEVVEAARARGLSVTGDVMPYPISGSSWGPRAVFPNELTQSDIFGFSPPYPEVLADLQAQVKNTRRRKELRDLIEARRKAPKSGDTEKRRVIDSWDNVYVEGVAEGSTNRDTIGLTIETIAAQRNMEGVDVYLDLLEQEGSEFSSTHIIISDDDNRLLLQQPWMMFGTDSIPTRPDLGYKPFNISQMNPGCYGGFPHILRRYTLDLGWLTIEEAIRKCAGAPAHVFGLNDRGIIRVGNAADIVVLDPVRLSEGATWLRPHQYAKGIEFVLVNGVPVVDTERLQESLHGTVLPGAGRSKLGELAALN